MRARQRRSGAGRRSRALACALLASTLALAPAPAHALVADPQPAPTRTGDADALETSTRAVAAMEAELLAGSDAASDALEAYQAATQRLAQARIDEAVDTLVAGDAATSAQSSHAAVSAWARWAYVHAGPAGDLSAALQVLQDATPSAAASALEALRAVSDARSEDAVRAAAVQRAAALDQARAAAASARSTQAAAQAAALGVRSRQLVAAQQARLAQLQAVLDADRAALRRRQEQQRLAAAKALAEQQRQRQAALVSGAASWSDEDGHAFAQRSTGALPVGSCAGGDLSGYPNGRLPTSSLCPLWGAPGQLLRADAAAAFDALSTAYAADFGAPMCISDSYRPLADQVRLARTKPSLAARPGTSNHGWGVALDLCGGIQGFGTAQHVWMLQHAPQAGWFHPSWARAGGSRPEPWHWEFAG